MSARSEPSDDAYAPLEAPDIVPLLSFVCFSASLAARPIARLLPLGFRRYPYGVVLPAAIAAGLALLGFLLALWAARRGRDRRGLARIGIFLNGVVLALTALAILGIFLILGR
jgi:hypothetical protein